jgi:hypothetical protein
MGSERLLGVWGLVTALVQSVVDAEIRCNKAVTSPRTPRRRPLAFLACELFSPSA